MLKIQEQENIGRAKYVVSYYTGRKHVDGSDFYDVRIFRNKRDKAKFVVALLRGEHATRT